MTDARERQGDLEPFLDAILDAGTDLVQLRQKDGEARDLLRWSEVFRRTADRHGALFILNDRPDVALAGGADGVHLGQDDLPLRFARELVGEGLLLGLSTHGPEQLDGTPPEADYLCVGPLWETPTKPGRPAVGPDALRHAAAHADRPWFAIGGIDRTNLHEVVAAGASRIVVVRAVTEAPDPAQAVRGLLEELPAVAPGRPY